MDMVNLKVTARSSDTSAKQLRRKGRIPGIVYGNKVENLSIECDEVALKKAYVKAGESTLVELDTGEKKLPVLFHSVDFDPVSDRLSHVDFYAVDMRKEVEADVPVRFEGEAPAVKDLSAILVTALAHVKVKCLPANLPHDLPVDLSKLTEFGSTITVADIAVPKDVEILNEPETVIAIAQEPREEEVEEAPATPAEGEAAAAGAEGAEGAPAAEGSPAPGTPEKKE